MQRGAYQSLAFSEHCVPRALRQRQSLGAGLAKWQRNLFCKVLSSPKLPGNY